MKTPNRLARTLPLPLLLALLAGCSSKSAVNAPGDPAAGTSLDQAEVSSTLGSNLSFVDDEVSETADQTALDSAVAAGGDVGALEVEAAIRPLAFWRDIRDVERNIQFSFRDPDPSGRPNTAIVTVHRLLRGSFNILVADDVPEGSPPSSHVIHKPLAENGVRRLLLRRVQLPESDRREWRVVATSGVRITSRDAQSRIDSLRIQSGSLDTTITDPLAFFRLRAILKLDPGAEVTLTAFTPRNDDIVLLYLRDHRARFQNNGDDTYTATFPAPDLLGLHHLGVNVLSNGTLLDDAAAYDSESWIEPYLIHPIPIADGTPVE